MGFSQAVRKDSPLEMSEVASLVYQMVVKKDLYWEKQLVVQKAYCWEH